MIKTLIWFIDIKIIIKKKTDTAEIRVYTNSRNQFSGIIIRPKWFDKYYEKDKYPTEK